jgi:hypothetical protein
LDVKTKPFKVLEPAAVRTITLLNFFSKCEHHISEAKWRWPTQRFISLPVRNEGKIYGLSPNKPLFN